MFNIFRFPYTSFEQVNLDWIMRKLAELDPQGNENPVSYDPQSPDATEQAQARTNLGLGDISLENAPLSVATGGTGAVDKATAAMNLEAVSWGAAQTLNSTQEKQARDNIGCGDLAVENAPLSVAKGGTGAIDKATAAMNLEAVSWGAVQTLNDSQKQQARDNIDAVTTDAAYFIPAADFDSHFENLSATYAARVTKQGKFVNMSGVVKPSENLSATGYNIFKLPAEYTPILEKYFICRCNGSIIWHMRINTNGDVDMYSAYNLTNGSLAALTTSNVLSCEVTYCLD